MLLPNVTLPSKPCHLQVVKPDGERNCTDYLVIVHVVADWAFKRFFEAASQADMPLFRGMFLNVQLSQPLQRADSNSSGAATDADSYSDTSSAPVTPRDGNPHKSPRLETPSITYIGFQQTFLPKFENERQDTSIANEIVAAADERYFVATVKHSGSLNTLSHNVMGAKNSVSNEFTGAAVLLLHAHYRRVFPCAPVVMLSQAM